VLLVEKNVKQNLKIASDAYVLENRRVALEGTGPSVLNDSHVCRVYLGVWARHIAKYVRTFRNRGGREA
jgi:branched-chain amino acid transport system ATP-binding protein